MPRKPTKPANPLSKQQLKQKRLPKLPISAVYHEPTEHWIVVKHGAGNFRVCFAEESQWRTTPHGPFASCDAAITFVRNM